MPDPDNLVPFADPLLDRLRALLAEARSAQDMERIARRLLEHIDGERPCPWCRRRGRHD